MSPKVTDGASTEAASFQFLFAVLKHNKSTIEPAWDEVANECHITYGRNANAKFKALLQKHGYRAEAGKILPIDGSAAGVVDTHKKTTQANGKKVKTPASSKKRKIDVEDDDAEGDDGEDIFKAEKGAGEGDKNDSDEDELA